MKIVMVGPYPEPGKEISGGVERVIDTLLPELASEVGLTLMVPGASVDAVTWNHGVKTIYLKRVGGPGALTYWTADARRLAREIDAIQPDLVHLQASSGVGRLITQPCILTIHGIAHRDLVLSGRGRRWGTFATYFAARLVQIIELRARRRMGSVIVINPYVIEALPDIASLKKFNIPNPLDPQFCKFLNFNLEHHDQRMIAVGRIGAIKNTLKIIQIACGTMTVNPEASLILCGNQSDANYVDACRKAIKLSGFEERIKMVGNLNTNELIEHFDRSSVLIVASQQENAPMAIAEAQARGVAVVAPEAFGIRHMIKPGRNGYFLQNGSIEKQVQCICAALDHNWDRAAIAAEAQAIYSSKKVAELTVASYHSVLESR